MTQTQPNIQRTTAVGLARFAYEYIDAAMLVDEAKGNVSLHSQASYTPAYFLAVHGIELCLKSYLLHTGVEVEALGKKYGHNLNKCLVESNARGLTTIFEMSADDKNAFQLLVEINIDHQLRYIQTGLKIYPLWSIVEPLAVRLHQAVAKKVGYHSFNRYYPQIVEKTIVVQNEKKDIKKDDIENAFVKMLNRIGGGFTFTEWLFGRYDVGSERSAMAEENGADISFGLYASDYAKQSHIAAYVSVVKMAETLHIMANIKYYEVSAAEINPAIISNSGETISSDSSPYIKIRGANHIGVVESLEILYQLIDRFKKNIAQI